MSHSPSIPPDSAQVTQELGPDASSSAHAVSMPTGPVQVGAAWSSADRASTTLPAGSAPTDGSDITERLNTTLLGKYRIDKLLGEGGCGRVYLATHLQLRSQVAIKFMLPYWQRRPVSRDRFRREARALALLSHPGIVAIHDFGEDCGDLYLIMEYVRGVPLSRLVLEDGQPLPKARAAALIDQLLDVLSAAHERGIIHRDLLPLPLSLASMGG